MSAFFTDEGPWEAVRYKGKKAVFINSRNGLVGWIHGFCDQRDDANARLMAAAPTLLEALETLASEEWRDDGDPILDAARIKARAAIAKAKGQA